MQCVHCETEVATIMLCCGHAACAECMRAMELSYNTCAACGCDITTHEVISNDAVRSSEAAARIIDDFSVLKSAWAARELELRTKRAAILAIAVQRQAELDAQMEEVLRAIHQRRAALMQDINEVTAARLKIVEDEEEVAKVQQRQLEDASAAAGSIGDTVIELLKQPVPASHVLTDFTLKTCAKTDALETVLDSCLFTGIVSQPVTRIDIVQYIQYNFDKWTNVQVIPCDELNTRMSLSNIVRVEVKVDGQPYRTSQISARPYAFPIKFVGTLSFIVETVDGRKFTIEHELLPRVETHLYSKTLVGFERYLRGLSASSNTGFAAFTTMYDVTVFRVDNLDVPILQCSNFLPSFVPSSIAINGEILYVCILGCTRVFMFDCNKPTEEPKYVEFAQVPRAVHCKGKFMVIQNESGARRYSLNLKSGGSVVDYSRYANSNSKVHHVAGLVYFIQSSTNTIVRRTADDGAIVTFGFMEAEFDGCKPIHLLGTEDILYVFAERFADASIVMLAIKVNN